MTTDGGENWELKDTGFSGFLASVTFGDPENAWIVGSDGAILKGTFDPTTSVEDNPGSRQPMGFQLSQNYPNPFNPVTTIEFSLSQPEFVTLTVFNLQGQTVAHLVSERMSAGTYRYQWDGGLQPSGLYFYRLEAGAFKSIRKMTLLR